MHLDQFRQFCLSLPETSESIKWDNLLCFTIQDKIFAVASPDDVPINVTLKVSVTNFEDLVANHIAIQAPYFAKRKWITITDIALIDNNKLEALIAESFLLVVMGLPKKTQQPILQQLALPKNSI